ncbi:hypothetical protein [Aureispira anguillae]|uniref:Uncharacterized protein n=1 Tax=Aureispira anguillae TaxID=2864201 RepID=A0A916DW42_9BACT|nr:hypothetical protein [Aureispira anguillae]BDS13706.1 hypothetical protein AsAng_0044470 [Aureispira anguillae]
MISVVRDKDFLYKNFLTKKTIYNQNESYWKRYVKNVLKTMEIEPESWLVNEFANGNKVYDGNPIYSAKIVDKKAIRIIQEEPESDVIQIMAWIDEAEDGEQGKLVELVISLELTKKTRELALTLIEKWASETTTKDSMNSFIEELL